MDYVSRSPAKRAKGPQTAFCRRKRPSPLKAHHKGVGSERPLSQGPDLTSRGWLRPIAHKRQSADPTQRVGSTPIIEVDRADPNACSPEDDKMHSPSHGDGQEDRQPSRLKTAHSTSSIGVVQGMGGPVSTAPERRCHSEHRTYQHGEVRAYTPWSLLDFPSPGGKGWLPVPDPPESVGRPIPDWRTTDRSSLMT